MTDSSNNVRRYSHWIGGSWTAASAESIERLNPANGRATAIFAAGTAEDADRAVAVARAAFDRSPWPKLAGAERGRLLLQWSRLIREKLEWLAQIEANEVGKPIRIARGDVQGAADLTEYAATLAFDIHGDVYDRVNGGDLGMLLREPIGVVAALVPWNFPALIFSQKVPFALAAGCTVIVKPSEMTSGTALEMARLAVQAGIPGAVLSVVTGLGPTVGQRLAEHPDVDMLSFTGSTAVARKIAAASCGNLKRTAFELGGKGATIVFDDADMDDAIDGSLFGVFFNQGETCCAGTRLLVQDSIADRFLQRLTERSQKLRVGDTLEDSTDIGALISPEHMDKVLRYVSEGIENGATLLTGGAKVNVRGCEAGAFVGPTILDHVSYTSRAYREEIFGPILTVSRFTSDEDAIALANDTLYGLSNSVWTKNVDRAVAVGRELRSGTVWINTATDGAPQLPFGGYKQSGLGREKGRAGLDEFLLTKTLHVHVGPRIPYYANAAGAVSLLRK